MYTIKSIRTLRRTEALVNANAVKIAHLSALLVSNSVYPCDVMHFVMKRLLIIIHAQSLKQV